MIKRNKKLAILSSVAILLPILAILLCWNRLDGTVIIHWGLDGQPDGMGSKYWLFMPPVLMLALHWGGLFISDWDSRRHPYGAKAEKLVFWLMPLLSWLMNLGMLTVSLGYQLADTAMLPLAGLGLLFIVLGNYMPKIQQNSTLGIKIKWALENSENWHATHRFAGKVWVAGGLLMLCALLLPYGAAMTVMTLSILLLAVLPAVYSWLYARKQKAAGTYTVDRVVLSPAAEKVGRWIALGITAAVALLLFVVFFTGNIDFELTDTALEIKADYWADLAVPYSGMTALEYRETPIDGIREGGYGSPRLLMGTFSNDEFGRHTRYSYTKCESAIVVTWGEHTLVLSGKDPAATRQLYEQLLARAGK